MAGHTLGVVDFTIAAEDRYQTHIFSLGKLFSQGVCLRQQLPLVLAPEKSLMLHRKHRKSLTNPGKCPKLPQFSMRETTTRTAWLWPSAQMNIFRTFSKVSETSTTDPNIPEENIEHLTVLVLSARWCPVCARLFYKPRTEPYFVTFLGCGLSWTGWPESFTRYINQSINQSVYYSKQSLLWLINRTSGFLSCHTITVKHVMIIEITRTF